MKSKFITTTLTCTIVGASLAQTYNQTFAATPQVKVSQFRSQGSQGLERFLNTYAKELSNPSPQMRAKLDAICQQKDCHASKLYWYTDIEQAKVVSNFETAMALDTVRNEYMLHRQIHQWFTQPNLTSNVNTLNERVYAQLFLTPSSDPWLGLMSSETYSAIQNDGIHLQKR